MKNLVAVLLFLLSAAYLHATPLFTPTIDGIRETNWGTTPDATSANYASLSSNMPFHSANACQDVYVTDDPTNLYIGYYYNGDVWANGDGNSARIMLGIITNPSGNSGGTADPWETTTTFGSANRPDFFVRQWTESPYDERMEFGGPLGSSMQTKGVAEFLMWSSGQWIGAGDVIHYERLTTNTTTTPTSPLTLYFKKPASWSANVNCYYWGGDCISNTWPGNATVNMGNGWYSYTLTGTQTSNIFVDAGNTANKTGNLYAASSGWYWTNNIWYFEDPETACANNWGEIAIPLSVLGLKTGSTVKLFMYYRPDNSKPGFSDSTPYDPNASPDGNTAATLNSNFSYTIRSDNVPPVIISNVPAQNTTNDRYVNLYFKVTDNMSFSSTNINVTLNGNAAVQNGAIQNSFGYYGYIVTDSTSSYEVYLTNMTFLFNQQVNAILSVVDASGNQTVKSYPFMIRSDTNPPVFFGPSPANGAIGVSRTAPISWSVGDDNQVAAASIISTVNGTVAYSNGSFQSGFTGSGSQITVYPVSNGYTVQISPNSSFVWRQQVAVTNIAADLSSNTSTNVITFSVTPDNIPPTLSNLSPANTAISVAKNAAISFSLGDDTQVLSNLLSVQIAGVGAIVNGVIQGGYTGSIVANGTGYNVTVAPTNGFSYNQVVSVQVIFQDTTTNTVTNTSSFTVMSDNVPPTLYGQNPVNGATGVSRSSAVCFIVDDDTAVNLSTLNLSIDGVNAISGGSAQSGYLLATSPTNHGYYVTVTPTTIFNYNQAVTMTVSVKDNAGNLMTGSWNFTIGNDTTPPVIFGISPTNGSSGLSRSVSVQSVVTDDNQVNQAGVYTTVNGVPAVSNGIVQTGFTGSVTASGTGFSVNVQPSGGFVWREQVVVTNLAADLAGNPVSNVSAFSITPDNIPPTISNLSPANLATGVAKNAAISFYLGDDTQVLSNLLSVQIAGVGAIVNGVIQGGYIGSIVANGSGYNVSVAPTNGFSYLQAIGVQVIFQDTTTNTVTNTSSFTVTPDNVPPTLYGQNPANGAMGVSRTSSVSFIVDDDTAVNPASINVKINGNSAVTNGSAQTGYTLFTSATNHGYFVTVTPASIFNYNQADSVTVTAQDTTGNSMTGSWNFTVGNDITPPVISGISPTNGSSGLSRSVSVQSVVTDDNQVNQASVYLTVNGVPAVSNGIVQTGFTGNVTAFGSGFSVNVQPSGGFTWREQVVVTNLAADLAGNPVSNVSAFSITPDNIPPTISNLSPANLATSIPKYTTISFLASDDTAVLTNMLSVRIIATDAVMISTNGVIAVSNGVVMPGFTGSVTSNANGWLVSIAPTNVFAYAQTVNVWAVVADTTTNTVTNTWSFNIKSDDVPPTISSQSPTNNQPGLPRSAAVSFIVNDDTAVAFTSLNVNVNGNAAVKNGIAQSGYNLSAAPTNNGYAVTVTPASLFSYNQTVSVYVTAQDTSQNSVDASWSFGIRSDNVPPSLSNASPTPDALAVSNSTYLSIVVTDDTAVNASTVCVTVNGTNALTNGVFAAAWDGVFSRLTPTGNGASVLIQPISNFGYRSSNTVSVTAADLSGNVFTSNWFFTIMPDNIPPFITNMYPGTAAQGIPSTPVFSFDTGDNVGALLSTLVVTMVTNGITNIIWSNGSGTGSWSNSTAVTNAYNGNTVTLKSSAVFSYNLEVQLIARVADAETNTTTTSGWNFIIQNGDSIPPTISRQQPVNGQVNVEPGVIFSFSTADNVGVLSNAITVWAIMPNGTTNLALTNGKFNSPFNGSGSAFVSNANNGYDVTIQYISNYQYSNSYEFIMSAHDNGNNFVYATNYFLVRGPDVIPPTIEQITPRSGSIDIPVTANLSFLVADNYGVLSNAIVVTLNGTVVLSNGVFNPAYTGPATTLTANDRNGWSIIINPVSDMPFGSNMTLSILAADTSTNITTTNVTFKLQELAVARAMTSFIDPKRGSSTIQIKVNRSGNATVSIYNFRGELVKSIPQKYYNIGDYIEWDGSLLNTQNKVGSGLYFISITGSDINSLVKVSIVR
jgi:hypothetical protein